MDQNKQANAILELFHNQSKRRMAIFRDWIREIPGNHLTDGCDGLAFTRRLVTEGDDVVPMRIANRRDRFAAQGCAIKAGFVNALERERMRLRWLSTSACHLKLIARLALQKGFGHK